jgi:HK97 family phage prohead protease
MSQAMRRSAVSCEFKALDEAPVGRFTGYASVFYEVDAYGDRVLPGAFASSLQEATAKGRLPAMLWQHNPSQPIGVWQTLREDDKGLLVTGELADTQLGREAYSLLKMGALSGLSIGYSVAEDRINRADNVRELVAVNLWEISPVTFPANAEARVEQVKFSGPAMTVREFERFLRDAGGFSAVQAKAIAARGFRSLRDEAPEDDEASWVQSVAARLSA